MVAGKAKRRVAAVDVQEVTRREGFADALRALAAADDRDYAEVEQAAKACLEELSVEPGDRYLGWVARLARFMYTRSFAAELDINRELLDRLTELARTRLLIFLWSHKSHLDAFVFMRSIYDANFTPQPLSFAGINMNFAGFGTLAKRSGAIFLRRSFKEDPVYKLVLQHYLDYLVEQRFPLSWSIEGTRSRTGRLMPPKLGLLQWVIESLHRAGQDDALLVPVAVSFDQIPEIDDFISMQRGVPKQKESLRWFLGYIAGMQKQYGKIHVRFGEPVALSDSVDVPAVLLSEDPEHAQTQQLAFEVCRRIEQSKPISAVDLVSLVLLAANNRALDAGQIQGHIDAITELIAAYSLPTVVDAGTGATWDVPATLRDLTETELLRCYEKGRKPVYSIVEGRQLAAAYYRNTITHFFLNPAIAELALASVRQGETEVSFWEAAFSLRDLFKFEFFFRKRDDFRRDITAYLDERYPDWRSRMRDAFAERLPLFGTGVLRSFVESYGVLAELLSARGAEGVEPANERTLSRECLELGEEMLLRGRITTEAALSGPVFEDAVRLVRHRGLLRGPDESLTERREAFAADLERIVRAVEYLQAAYDRVSVAAGHAPRPMKETRGQHAPG